MFIKFSETDFNNNNNNNNNCTRFSASVITRTEALSVILVQFKIIY